MDPTLAEHRLPRIAHEAISVLVPVFNQAAGLPAILENWTRTVRKLTHGSELIVIDDGSTDATPEIGGAPSRGVRFLRHEQRRGYGACIRSGLLAAENPLVFLTACDYPYAPSDIKKLLDAIDLAHIVCGCRTDPMPGWLRSIGQGYRAAARVLFGIPLEPRPGWQGWRAWRRGLRDRWLLGLRLHDVSCAFTLIRKSTADAILLQSNGSFVRNELLAKANFMGCLIAEVPIGKLAGPFKGVLEPLAATEHADRRTVFRRPVFAKPPIEAEPAPVVGAY